jgi:phage-related protein
MKVNFEVELLPEAFAFIKKQDFKTRKKIFQNINRAKQSLDPALFKKLSSEIWEFRTRYNGVQYRLLAFWDKTSEIETIVFATHGFKKKTDKVAKREIQKADKIRIQYFENKL